jgi:hypothetical protein
LISHKTPVRRSTTRRLGGGLLAALLLSGCTDFAGYDLDYLMGKVPFLATMRSTVAGLFITSRLPRVGRAEALYHPSFSGGRFGVFAHVGTDRFDQVRTIMTESGSEEVLLDQP